MKRKGKIQSTMILIKTVNECDFYRGENIKTKKVYYNIVPHGSEIPNAGYYSSVYITKVKNVPNYFMRTK